MSKELTEQWRNGTLKTGWYYTKHDDGKIYVWFCFKDDCYYNPEVKEVIAAVPNYEKVKEMSQKIERLEFDNEAFDNELKELATKNDTLVIENGRLQEQLRIATKALEEYANSDNWYTEKVEGEYVFCFNIKYPWRFSQTTLYQIKELNK